MVMRQYIIMYVDTLGIERALHFEEASTNHLSIEYVTNNEVVLRNQHTAVIPFFGVGGWKYELKRRKSNTKVKKKVRINKIRECSLPILSRVDSKIGQWELNVFFFVFLILIFTKIQTFCISQKY